MSAADPVSSLPESSATRVLLLGPGNSSHTLEWRQVIAEQTAGCVLASLHPCSPDDVATGNVVRLAAGGGGFVLRLPRAVREARRLVRSEKFDLVLAYYLTSYGLVASLAVPHRFVAVGAGSDLFPQRLKALRTLAARRTLGTAAGGLAWTSIMGDRMVDLGLPAGRVRVGARGVNRRLFKPPDGPRHDGGLRVISTRRLRPLFRLDVLLRAAAEMRRRDGTPRLEMIGEGTERGRLEALAADLDLRDTVAFLGNLPKQQVAERLSRADVFVSLSRSDGLSASLLEAMSCGLVPVVSDIPSNRSVITDGENGLVVGGDDPIEVAEALERAHRDDELRDRARRLNDLLAGRRFDIHRNTADLLETARRWLRDPAATGTGGPR